MPYVWWLLKADRCGLNMTLKFPGLQLVDAVNCDSKLNHLASKLESPRLLSGSYKKPGLTSEPLQKV